MDIATIILEQHAEQRRMFAWLDEIGDDDRKTLSALWHRLEILLETHADGEERYLYPVLLRHAHYRDEVSSEVKDAVKDHNEIRDGIRDVRGCDTGTPEWRKAVASTRRANSDHMAEEEREDLPATRRLLSLEDRHRIAVDFLRHQADTYADGLPLTDRDPQQYVTPPAGA